MNKKLVGLSALALSLSMSQAPLAYADHMKCFSGEHVAQLTEKLDVTADQKAKIKSIRDQAREAMKPKFKEMIATRMQINQLFKSGNPDAGQLDTLINQQKETFGAILKIRLMERHDIAGVLNDQQKAKLATMIQQLEAKHHEDKQDSND